MLRRDGASIFDAQDRPANRVMRFSTSGATLGPLVGDVGDPALISPQNIEGDGQGQLYISNGDGKLRMHVRGTSGAFVRVMDYPSGGNPTGGAFAQGVLFLKMKLIKSCILHCQLVKVAC